MILLSRALYNLPEADTRAMKETLSSLSEKLVGEAELILAEREGTSINRKKLEIIAEEEKLIEAVCMIVELLHLRMTYTYCFASNCVLIRKCVKKKRETWRLRKRRPQKLCVQQTM